MFQLPVPVSFSSPAAKEWFGQHHENVRPWILFINTRNFHTPSSLSHLAKRIARNVEYFQTNYFFVLLGLIFYCLITSPLLLIAVAASLGVCYILSMKNSEWKITVFAYELTLAQQYGLVAVCFLPLFYIAGAGAAMFWVLGTSVFIITLHASFYNIDAVLNLEDEKMDVLIEDV
ncbi:hypothetical protein B7P43_G17244 [Cryptotermes secundus]|uniref:PRA1 family protein n=2 Tax=Cryptotermes secundus TaxID=105785 RepID=A0A2J7Q588_9NEOP|nr:prenylated Rab acceptor protein 1 isoform X2 [Cryptotermes secundus]XP_033609434.1 prenylated Rab acceptor protein 1 isoform X2 [Cryptotermes secundus]PNF23740.1 hypothetical protein B7P43_G17244 [Cryptotermes secundus]